MIRYNETKMILNKEIGKMKLSHMKTNNDTKEMSTVKQ